MKKVKLLETYSVWDGGDILTDFKGNGFYKQYQSDEFGLSKIYIDTLITREVAVYV